MPFINVELQHNNTDISNLLVDYNREQYICTGIATLSIKLVDNGRSYDPWDTLELWEEGNKKGTFYIQATETAEDGSIKLASQDESIKLVDYFIPEQISLSYLTTARYWIQRFLEEAGVNYTFTTDDSGAPVAPDSAFGLTSAYESIVSLLQMSGWYIYFNANGTAIVGKLSVASGNPDGVLTDTTILELSTNTNDKMLRNRAVVWGGADIISGTWIYADISVITGWNYDANDKRAVVLANSYIYTYQDAYRLANQMLGEFNKITEEKTVTVVGELDVTIGDYIFINSDKYAGGGIVTSISSTTSKSGFITTLILDQRCPRLFGFYSDFDDFVYVGTAGDGVWRKPLSSGSWNNYSAGITDLGINDLSINNNIFASTTFSGLAYRRTLLDSSWIPYTPPVASGVINSSGIFVTDIIPSGVYAVACTVDKLNSNIYFAFTSNSGIISSGFHLFSGGIPFGEGYSWLATLSNTGYLQRFDQVLVNEGGGDYLSEITIVDLDNSGTDVILTGYGAGSFVLPPIASGDDGNFSNWNTVGFCLFIGPVDSFSISAQLALHTARRSATDFRAISSLPPADVIGDLTMYSEGSPYGTCTYNRDDDLGTYYGTWDYRYASATKGVAKSFWVYDGTYHAEVDPSFDFDISGFAATDRVLAYWIDEESKDMHFLCTDVEGWFVGTGTITYVDYYLKIYKYDYSEATLSLLSTRTFYHDNPNGVDPYTQDTTSAFFYRNGYGAFLYQHIYATYNPPSSLVEIKAYIFNLRNGTYNEITFINDEVNPNDGATATVRRVFYPPVPTEDYIIYPYINQFDEFIGNNIWGDVNLYTFSLNTNNGSYNTNYKQIWDEGRSKRFDAGAWIFHDADRDFILFRIALAIQNGTNSIFLSLGTMPSLVSNITPPFDPINECILFTCNITPTSISNSSTQWTWLPENEPYPEIVFAVCPWPLWAFIGQRAGVTSYENLANGGLIYPVGSTIRGDYYGVLENLLSEYSLDLLPIHNYAVNRVTTNGFLLLGYMDFPTAQMGSTAKYLQTMIPKVDDVDGTLYGMWYTSASPSSKRVIGHSNTGNITKALNAANFIINADTGKDWYDITANIVHDSQFSKRWGYYEQPRGEIPTRYLVLKQEPEPNSFTIIEEPEYIPRLDISKSAPTVAYFLSQSGQPLSNLSTSWSNQFGTFQPWFLNFPLYDVRTFDLGDPGAFIVESGITSISGFRNIAFVSSGGVYFVDAYNPEVTPNSLITISGMTASGITTPSGLFKMETSNYSNISPYFFVSAQISGFWQRDMDAQLWVDYSQGLPGSQITIIRVDDRI